jgi:hypothetical protein
MRYTLYDCTRFDFSAFHSNSVFTRARNHQHKPNSYWWMNQSSFSFFSRGNHIIHIQPLQGKRITSKLQTMLPKRNLPTHEHLSHVKASKPTDNAPWYRYSIPDRYCSWNKWVFSFFSSYLAKGLYIGMCLGWCDVATCRMIDMTLPPAASYPIGNLILLLGHHRYWAWHV